MRYKKEMICEICGELFFADQNKKLSLCNKHTWERRNRMDYENNQRYKAIRANNKTYQKVSNNNASTR